MKREIFESLTYGKCKFNGGSVYGKSLAEKKISLDRIKKSFGQVTEHIISLTSKVQQSEI